MRAGPDVKAMALGRIRELAEHLAPDCAAVEGHRRWSLNPTRADARPNSFCIDISGPCAGRFYEFAGDDGGDVIDLVSYVISAGAANYQSAERRGAAFAWLKRWLGVSGAARPVMNAAEQKRAQLRAEADRKRQAQQAERAAAEKALKALGWFAAQTPVAEGDPVWRYLNDTRRIPLRQLARFPRALRFAPALTDAPTGTRHPGMIAAMTGPEGKITGVHRTFLTAAGRKAGLTDAHGRSRDKQMWGVVRGAAIRLARGENKCSPEEAARRGLWGETLAVSEGIENGLTHALLEPAHRVWATGSLSNMANLAIPATVERLLILADNDRAGSKARIAMEGDAARPEGVLAKLQTRYRELAIEISRPARHKDLNAVLMAAARAQGEAAA